jgi:hypothetical protein
VLIVSGGTKTEPNYFRCLARKDEVARNYHVVVKSQGVSASQIVDLAEVTRTKGGDEYDEIWCVIDTEGTDELASVKTALSQAAGIRSRIADNASTLRFEVCLSKPCFEIWLLAHFTRTTKAYQGFVDVLPDLNRRWRREFNRDYDKADANLYERVQGRTSTAIENARHVREKSGSASPADLLDLPSATDVYKLVEHLLNPI